MQDIDRTLEWLQLLMANQIEKASGYSLEKLPFLANYTFSNFRLMIDM